MILLLWRLNIFLFTQPLTFYIENCLGKYFYSTYFCYKLSVFMVSDCSLSKKNCPFSPKICCWPFNFCMYLQMYLWRSWRVSKFCVVKSIIWSHSATLIVFKHWNFFCIPVVRFAFYAYCHLISRSIFLIFTTLGFVIGSIFQNSNHHLPFNGTHIFVFN